jgi:hypothetical protein
MYNIWTKEKEDIRGHKEKKGRQPNGQKRKDIKTNDELTNTTLHRKLKIVHHEPTKKLLKQGFLTYKMRSSL